MQSNQVSVALDQLDAIVGGAVHADPRGPTPCRDWDIGALIDHLLHDLELFHEATLGQDPDWSSAAPHVPQDAWLSRLRDARGVLQAAWAAGGSGSVEMQVTELTVHTWDLAQATGQQADLDDQLAVQSLAYLRENLKPEYRGNAFDAEQKTAGDATPYEQLAAFTGRSLQRLGSPPA